ncbi:MAG: tripartite tricarboxylate transporter permease [Candidatus Limiplasma sp.]|nr:tripartite tricarboxylate transporter permease [Candidatus Limiplasma sp.]
MAIQYVMDALQVVFSPFGFIALVLAVLLGLIFGMLPGLTATMAVALLTGLTYSFSGPLAVLVLIGVYIGSISGGCQSAILLNIPGTPASAATAMEGYPLALQGKGGLAIFVANAASFFGTLIGVFFVALATPLITSVALKFQSYEMFLLAVFGIIICGNLTSNGRPVKGWIAGFVGLLISQVGRDTVQSFPRFTFGSLNLSAGISLLPVMIGLFGFPEIVNAFVPDRRDLVQVSKFSPREGFAIVRRNWKNILRSGVLGMSMGAIPGVGEDTGGWLSYWSEKKSSKSKLWGRGEIDGVVSAEAGNNAAIGGAIIPVLSLAIPGSAPAAVLLAAFWMHGYRPGPLLMSETPEFLYYVVVFMVFSAIIMWVIASNMSRLTVRVLQVDQRTLMPVVFICCVIGAFVVNNRLFDVKLMFVFGLLGVAMKYMKYPAAPFLLGVILGNMADENLRRGLILSDGSILPFFTRPLCIFFLLFILVLVIPQIPGYAKFKARLFKRGKAA